MPASRGRPRVRRENPDCRDENIPRMRASFLAPLDVWVKCRYERMEEEGRETQYTAMNTETVHPHKAPITPSHTLPYNFCSLVPWFLSLAVALNHGRIGGEPGADSLRTRKGAARESVFSQSCPSDSEAKCGQTDHARFET